MWNRILINLPTLIGAAMQTAELIKSAHGGKEKEAAVISAVKANMPLAEIVAGRDLVNDPALDQLLSAYIQARVALTNFVAKPPVPEGVVVPPQ